jgi:hypothetical protein
MQSLPAALLLFAVSAPSALPANYDLVLSDPDVLVYHVHYGAHEHVPEHPHPAYPTMFIYLDHSGPIRFTHAGLPPEVTLRPPSQPGSYRIAPALAETHSVDNLGDTPSDSIRVEFKHVTAGVVPGVFRGAAPAHLADDAGTVEYTNTAFSVERVVCVVNVVCPLADQDRPSLVVGLSPSLLLSPDSTDKPLAVGEVRALPPSTPLRVTAAPGSEQPAHLLRIVLTPRQ